MQIALRGHTGGGERASEREREKEKESGPARIFLGKNSRYTRIRAGNLSVTRVSGSSCSAYFGGVQPTRARNIIGERRSRLGSVLQNDDGGAAAGGRAEDRYSYQNS